MEPIFASTPQDRAPAQDVRIRPAVLDDTDSILAIYAPYIDTPVTFEEVAPSPGEFRSRVAALLAEYPYLVAERNGSIIGYAYAHVQAERAAYDWNAELSVYLAPDEAGCGLGRVLYRALIDLLRTQGVQCAYARVTVPNAASERLHAVFGFNLMGVQRNAGYTCGAWRDVAWYTLALGAFEANPAPRRAFLTLDTFVAGAIIEQANDTLKRQAQPANNTADAFASPPSHKVREKDADLGHRRPMRS